MPRIAEFTFTEVARCGRNQLGFALIEGLVAAAITVTVAVGTTGLVSYVYKQSRRVQVLNRAIGVQSSLLNALMDQAQFRTGASERRDSLIRGMVAGTAPVNLEILKDPTSASSGALAVVGARLYYGIDDTEGHASSACADGPCALAVDLDLRCDDVDTAGCRAAYRITVEGGPDEVLPPPLGANPGPADSPRAFVPSDYGVVLSFDFFQRQLASDCSADPGNVFITGMNRVSGDVTCIPRQTVPCADGQIAHGVAVDVAADGRRRLEMQCHPLAVVKCPDNYVLQRMNYGQLDLGKGFTGGAAANLRATCVYRWRNDVAWQGPSFRTDSTTSSASYTAPVCNPRVYDTTSGQSCEVAWDSNPGVYCPADCPVYDAAGVQTGTRDCSQTIYASAYASGSIDSAAGAATCTVNVQQQSCDAGTTSGVAHGRWSGRCLVKERLDNPSLVKAPERGVLGI